MWDLGLCTFPSWSTQSHSFEPPTRSVLPQHLWCMRDIKRQPQNSPLPDWFLSSPGQIKGWTTSLKDRQTFCPPAATRRGQTDITQGTISILQQPHPTSQPGSVAVPAENLPVMHSNLWVHMVLAPLRVSSSYITL